MQEVLARDPQLPATVVVTGVLAFFDADWPLFPPDRIDDVRLEGPRSTTRLVLRDGPHRPAEVALIADRLAAHFPGYRSG